MPPSNELTATLDQINLLLEQTRGSSDQFAETLRHQHVPHLSFSQVTTVEACQYRYYLQYVKLLDPQPLPDYFTKGKLLHQVIAASYASLSQNHPIQIEDYHQFIDQQLHGEHQRHLHNAVTLHLENLWRGCEIVAVEEPFVMAVDDTLPPCVGVIDLILEHEGQFIVIDHKTGRDFYPEDHLQMAIYVAYIHHKYGVQTCQFYYDHYRWVNNLARIRKPAFQRTPVTLPEGYWETAVARIRGGYRHIQHIRDLGWGTKNGECFRCPYRGMCWS
jgi:ATP-dependent exoDNAse (exonuclease V) beta subunit